MLPESPAPLFTVLTPTWNRADTLPRLYQSLCQQRFRRFEWLVIDDGSTDDTHSLVMAWQKHSAFSLRYRYQKKAGKHIAFNRGVAESRGELIAQIDSDDELLPDTLELLVHYWNSIAPHDRYRYVGVSGLCLDDYGRIIGDSYPSDSFTSDELALRYRYHIRGEKWGFQRREILQKFPFPTISGVSHVPESIVWSAIARLYKTLYINVPLRIYHADAVGGQIVKLPFQTVARSVLLDHQNNLNKELDWFFFAPMRFLISAIHYTRASLHERHSTTQQIRSLCMRARLLWVLTFPIAYLIYLRDCVTSVRGGAA